MTLARIGRFQVERALGSGSFATVWLARDEDLDAWVAIKLLAENWTLNEDARRRFMEEARALRRLDSDRIVRVYEVGRLNDGRPYMVMEFADRGTLEDRMRLRAQLDQPFSVAEAVAVGLEMAECLIAVHDLRIVHRDVKPSNVLFRGLPPERQEALRRDGKPASSERTLLGDFGIARRLEGVLGHTMVVGSPQYMAPEQADPVRAASVDFRGDVYSAAVILFELLAARLPFAFESVTELRAAAPTARTPSVGEWRSDVPAGLGAVIERGLAREPGDRFPSAWEWRDALRDSLHRAEGGPPGPEGPPRVSALASLGLDPAPEVDTEPLPSPAAAFASAGSGAARVPAARSGPATAPVGTRRRTAVLAAQPIVVPPVPAPRPLGQFEEPDAVAPEVVNVRVPGALTVLAGLLLMASLMLPWASIRGADGPEERLGAAFRGGSFAALGAIALFLLGLRMWRTRRRWVAAASASLAALVGAGAIVLAAFELVEIEGHVRATLTGRFDVASGSGLYALLAGAVISILSGWRALRRLRRLRRLESYPRLRAV